MWPWSERHNTKNAASVFCTRSSWSSTNLSENIGSFILHAYDSCQKHFLIVSIFRVVLLARLHFLKYIGNLIIRHDHYTDEQEETLSSKNNFSVFTWFKLKSARARLRCVCEVRWVPRRHVCRARRYITLLSMHMHMKCTSITSIQPLARISSNNTAFLHLGL